MKKRLISMLCASTIAFLLALPSYAFDSDMATSAKVNADIAELKETYSTAYKQAPKSSQLATVVVNAYTKWNSEDISIRFTQ